VLLWTQPYTLQVQIQHSNCRHSYHPYRCCGNTPSPFKLRWSPKSVRNQRKPYKQGVQTTFVYAPTGSGKTWTQPEFANAAAKNHDVCFSSPWCTNKQSLAIYNIQVMGIIKADIKKTLDIQIASIQSSVNTPDGIDVIVIDECHTTVGTKLLRC